MYILGINDSHCATAALIKNGRIIACASEERFIRIKNAGGIPFKSIDYCLKQAHINPSSLDCVVFAGKTLPPLDYEEEKTLNQSRKSTAFATKLYRWARHRHYFILRQTLEYKFPFFRKFNEAIYKIGLVLLVSRFMKQRSRIIANYLKIPEDRIDFIDHHLCHAYAGLYSSRFAAVNKKVLIFTCDCQGDGLCASVNIFRKGRFKRISETPMQNSLGSLYTETTIFLGMKPNEHEYKVMGLAPYAPKNSIEKTSKILRGLISLDQKTLTFRSKVSSDLMALFLRDNFSRLRFDYIAGAVQKLTEDLLAQWIQTAVNKYKIRTIVCSGGVKNSRTCQRQKYLHYAFCRR